MDELIAEMRIGLESFENGVNVTHTKEDEDIDDIVESYGRRSGRLLRVGNHWWHVHRSNGHEHIHKEEIDSENTGTCLVKYLVCLVIDEAHRATGNYLSCVAERELLAVPVQLRILALTATPGSKHEAVQGIIDNLQIATLEYHNESDPDKFRAGGQNVIVDIMEVDLMVCFDANVSPLRMIQRMGDSGTMPISIMSASLGLNSDSFKSWLCSSSAPCFAASQ
ncbi:hypothetical protein ACFE04_002982 [Oxalis oulophora]